MEEFVIIGGGIAGLSAANRLADLKTSPLLIEAGNYPSHKICGEFFSPECLPQVKQWGIHPEIMIPKIHFHTSGEPFQLKLPHPGFSMSHISFDPKLVEYGISKGVRLKTGVRVTNLIQGKPYRISLSTGEEIQAKNLIIATGRLPQLQVKNLPLPYTGIKAHFCDVPIGNAVEMFVFPEGYLGISKIEEGKANVACLAKAESVAVSPSAFIESLMKKNKRLAHLLQNGKMLFPEWMSGPVPEFGFKKNPKWENSYFIGDAVSIIPPICGEGLSIAIHSGILAADCAYQNQEEKFRKLWQQKFSSRIRWGILLHKTMLNPLSAKILTASCRLFPSIASKLYERTRV